jgi:two-component system OmpR family sensor kinase
MSYAPSSPEQSPSPLQSALRRARLTIRALGATLARVPDPFQRLPIRVRLAVVSTALTFVILCSFAAVVGDLTTSRLRSDFYHQVDVAADDVQQNLAITMNATGKAQFTPLGDFTEQEHALIRILTVDGTWIAGTNRNLGPLLDENGNLITSENINGYRVENRSASILIRGQAAPGQVVIQYARPLSDVESTIARVRLLLILGVLAATGLALLGGLMIARRAMRPIARLTSTAREITRTGDPRRSVPQPEADDEVAELARTFDEMLHSLDAARGETEAMLFKQRQFVADASHELRTPLTSVLANLELLAESLDGEQGEAARSALRSSQRMGRLIADLLLLARSDGGRVPEREPTDLADVAVEAAGELGPVAVDHAIVLDACPAVVSGTHDELFRLVLNLIENAVRHTPAGTTVTVHTATTGDGEVEVVVADDGPGIPAQLAPHLFERFVRGDGDRGGSFGLGLAIVRAVAETHGGSVTLDPGGAGSGRGACFTVRLPAAMAQGPDSQAREDGAVPSELALWSR